MRDARVLAGPWDNPGVEPTPDEIRAALGRILASPRFANAERLSRFLRYIVEQTLAGAADGLKEFVVATAVFDRDASYDPRIDAVVRVEAGRLRSRLAEYYAEHGSAEPIRIHVPKGGYVPAFERRRDVLPPQTREAIAASRPNGATLSGTVMAPGMPAAASASVAAPQVSATRPGGRWRGGRPLVVVAASAVAVAIGAVTLSTGSWRARPAAGAAVSVLVTPLHGEDLGAVDGVAAALSRALVGAGGFDVVAHSRVQDAAVRGDTAGQLARTFDADYTVEGRVDARGEAITVEVALIDARAGRKVWVAQFAGSTAARSTVVAEAAAAIAAAVPAASAAR